MDTRNQQVLVTGGRGFIGRAVVKLLQRSGYEAVALDTAPLNQSAEGSEEVLCDITDAAQLQRLLESRQFGGIIHLAAILPTAAQRNPQRATRVNVEGSLRLLQMARRSGVGRFVFGSSLSVYGTCPVDQVVSEADRGAPEDLYGAAKLYVERLGEVYRQSDGLEFVSLRIGRVIGAGAQSASSAWRSQIFELLPVGDTAEIVMPYAASERILLVHVYDAAKMLVALLQAPQLAHSIYNAACESVVVADLKRVVESLNSNISVTLGDDLASGNPRRLDCSRFQQEFGFQSLPVFQQLRKAAEQ